jgi:hypothetical protein
MDESYAQLIHNDDDILRSLIDETLVRTPWTVC